MMLIWMILAKAWMLMGRERRRKHPPEHLL
jgi:hypothetical protein